MKRNGMFLDQPLEQLLEQLEADHGREPAESTASEQARKAEIAPQSLPHPTADANKAAELNERFQAELAKWKALPWWKRIRTQRPELPKGI